MKILLFILWCVWTIQVCSQTRMAEKEPAGEQSIIIGVAGIIPLGEFSSTHYPSVGVDCSPSHSFQAAKQKRIAFTWNGGLAYYVGRKENVNGYSYKYPNFFFIHAFGGIRYHPVKRIDLNLTAGPGLGIYSGKPRFNPGSKLELGYRLCPRFVIGPGIILIKEPGADPLWSTLLKVTLAL